MSVNLQSEAGWVIPCTLLTIASGAAALLLLPDYSGVMPALQLMPLWLFVAALAWALCGPQGLFPMMIARIPSPLSHLAQYLVRDWKNFLLVAFGTLIAGLNMVTFMWTKPLLNYYVPFWADPLLTRMDHILFLGHDPWSFLGWLNSMPMAIFYHRGWFALMIATLLVVLSRPGSREKSAVLLSYFLLWSAFGPLVHCLLPAGGPVFFEPLGYGNRFAAIALPDEMVVMTDYLWNSYAAGGFGPGSGISAMPSLHIATTAWMMIAIRIHAPRWLWPAGAAGALIFLLSISLGWHYAVDGVAGGAGALLCYWVSRRFLEMRAANSDLFPAEPADAKA